MNTELSEQDLPCTYRGKPKKGFNVCRIHGLCSLEQEHSRVRACVLCSDRVEHSVGELDPSAGLLGNRIESILDSVGVTKDRVTKWIGQDCNCDETRGRLNRLHLWIMKLKSGKSENPKQEIEQLLSE